MQNTGLKDSGGYRVKYPIGLENISLILVPNTTTFLANSNDLKNT